MILRSPFKLALRHAMHALFVVTTVFAAAPSPAQVNFKLQTPTTTPGQVLLFPHVYFVWWNVAYDPANLIVDVREFLLGLPGSKWNGMFTEYGGSGFDQSGYSVLSWPSNSQPPLKFFSWGAQFIDRGQAVAGAPAYKPPSPDVPELPTITDPTSIKSNASDWNVALQNEAIRGAKYFGVQNDPNAIIVVLSPPRKYPLDTQVIGAASHFTVNAGGSLPTVAIDMRYPGSLDRHTGAYIWPYPYPGGRVSVSYLLQHEINEAVTDPHGTGWLAQNQMFGGEVADLEENLLTTTLSRGRDGNGEMQVKLTTNVNVASPQDSIFTIAPSWSNAMAQTYNASFPASAHMLARANQIDAASWARSYNISSDGTYTPARFSIATNRHLQYLGVDNSDLTSAWQDWGIPGNVISYLSSPVAVATHSDTNIQQDVFALGQVIATPPPHLSTVVHLFHISTSLGVRTAWQDMGTLPAAAGGFVDIAASSYGPLDFDLFATTTSGQLWGLRIDENSTSGNDWVALGAPPEGIASGPAAVSWVNGYQPHARVYVVTKTGKLSNTQFDGWGSPTPQSWVLDTTPTAPVLRTTVKPAVANITSPRTFDVIALDTAGNVWHRGTISSLLLDDDGDGAEIPPEEGWQNWGHPASGPVAIAPAVASLASRMLLIDAIGADSHVYEMAKWNVGIVSTGNYWVNQGGTTAGGVTLIDP